MDNKTSLGEIGNDEYPILPNKLDIFAYNKIVLVDKFYYIFKITKYTEYELEAKILLRIGKTYQHNLFRNRGCHKKGSTDKSSDLIEILREIIKKVDTKMKYQDEFFRINLVYHY